MLPNVQQFLIILASLLCIGVAKADVVQMVPPSQAPSANSDLHPQAMHRPYRGMTMHEVEKRYGKPTTKHPPVGGGAPQRPPITRWDYPGFSVFFEHHLVIDTVIPGHPPPVYHIDQLRHTS